MAEAVEQPNQSASKYLTEPSEIVAALKVFRDHRAPLTLRFDGELQSFTVRILDVNNDELLLEDMQPRNGLPFMNQRRPFSLACRTQGVYLYVAESRADRTDSERGVPYFHVHLPHQVLFQQRRRSSRVKLPLRVSTNNASVRLFRSGEPGEEPQSGSLIDVSVGGCRAEFEGPADPPFQADEPIKHCEIHVPPLLEVHASAIVRHFSVTRGGKRIVAGIELTEMDVTDRRRLEQFIEQIDRTRNADTRPARRDQTTDLDPSGDAR